MDANFGQSSFLDALRAVQRAGGNLRPQWHAGAAKGYSHFPDLDDESAEKLTRDLDYLARIDHLDRLFFDRLTVCPSCGSHQVNVREVCSDCKSPHITPVALLHHFRCGYVGHADVFPRDANGGRRCPKCHGHLQDLGTDHDSPGVNFLCHGCHASFQVPDVESICLSCHARSASDQLLHQDIYSYRLNSLGMSALSNGKLLEFDGNPLFEGNGSGIYRRQVFMAMLEDERCRAQRYGSRFVLLALRLNADTPEDTKQLTCCLEKALRRPDKIGRYDDRHVLLLMPESYEEDAFNWLEHALSETDGSGGSGASTEARLVDLNSDADLASRLSACIAELERG